MLDILILVHGAPATPEINPLTLLRLKLTLRTSFMEPGVLYGIGSNYNFNLGLKKNDVIIQKLTQIDGMKQKVKIAVSGYSHSLILTESNELYTCGYNTWGQNGHVDTIPKQTPTFLMQNYHIVDVDAGEDFSVLLMHSGEVLTLGNNEFGQLGRVSSGTSDRKPAKVGINKSIKQIAAGAHHLLLLSEDGVIHGCGQNANGELGIGNYIDQAVPAAVTIPSGEKVIMIGAGTSFSACVESGKVYAFGNNTVDELGTGNATTRNSNQPVLVAGVSEPVVKISCGSLHTLALTATGKLFVFGSYYHASLHVDFGSYPPRYPTPQVLNTTFKPPGYVVTDFLAGNCHSYVIVRTSKGEQKLLVHGCNRDSVLGNANYREPQLVESKLCGGKRIVAIGKSRAEAHLMVLGGEDQSSNSSDNSWCTVS